MSSDGKNTRFENWVTGIVLVLVVTWLLYGCSQMSTPTTAPDGIGVYIPRGG